MGHPKNKKTTLSVEAQSSLPMIILNRQFFDVHLKKVTMPHMLKSTTVAHATHVGMFLLVLYALCVAWSTIYPYSNDTFSNLLPLLQFIFPGFQRYAEGSIAWGGFLTFAYGFGASILFHVYFGKCCKTQEDY